MRDTEIYTLALTKISGLGSIGACNLIKELGSAEEVFRNRTQLPSLVKGASEKLVKALDCSEAFDRAEKELKFADKNQIRCITIKDSDYPSRLRECDDAPIALFYRGNANLNAAHMINLVGTRHATAYGQEICSKFISELTVLCPDIIIVSGLAYGIDIHAHRAALQNCIPTIGVLAHGLDRIYPAAHRKTAVEMLDNGGLLTEFMSETNPDRQNFIKRNRIVAGICDATIVVESASKGGALITADIAESYNRDCFAFPGRINDEYSKGCNDLIRRNKAALINTADEFVNIMGWCKSDNDKPVVQRELFPDLSAEEQSIVSFLRKYPDGIQINIIVVECNIAINRLNCILFEMEMKGIVRALAGGVYKLLQ